MHYMFAFNYLLQRSLHESIVVTMASGLPIIYSNAGGLKYVITNNVEGIMYKSKRVKSSI